MEIKYQLMKDKDDFCISEEQLISLLGTSSRIKIDKENNIIKIGNSEIKYSIYKEKEGVAKEVIFIITFSIENEKKIRALEEFNSIFIDIINKYYTEKNRFSLNVLRDDISKYYGEKLYPKINRIENYLREIIYTFMGRNLGVDWSNRSLPEDISNNIRKKDKVGSLNNILQYTDFIELGDFLFTEFPLYKNQKNLTEELAKLGDIQSLQEILKKYEYKSNWDRYFSDQLDSEKFEMEWKELYKYRNMVAHNKEIRKKDYEEVLKIIKKLEGVFEKCLTKISDIDVPETEKENLENASKSLLNEKYSTFHDTYKKILYKYYIERYVNDSNINFNKKINEYLESLEDKNEE